MSCPYQASRLDAMSPFSFSSHLIPSDLIPFSPSPVSKQYCHCLSTSLPGLDWILLFFQIEMSLGMLGLGNEKMRWGWREAEYLLPHLEMDLDLIFFTKVFFHSRQFHLNWIPERISMDVCTMISWTHSISHRLLYFLCYFTNFWGYCLWKSAQSLQTLHRSEGETWRSLVYQRSPPPGDLFGPESQLYFR